MAAPLHPALFRRLPPVDEVLRMPSIVTLVTREGHVAVTDAVRSVLARLREAIVARQLDDSQLDLALGGLEGAVRRQALGRPATRMCPHLTYPGTSDREGGGGAAPGGEGSPRSSWRMPCSPIPQSPPLL